MSRIVKSRIDPLWSGDWAIRGRAIRGPLERRYLAWLDLFEAGYGLAVRDAEALRCAPIMRPLILEERQQAHDQEAARIAERARRKRLTDDARLRRVMLARPRDMGGPRDVWMTFFPPPDPRLDNMEPVSP